jgi:hypothetical protein
LNITTADIGGYIPKINHAGLTQFREKRLFFSEPEVALIIQKNVRGGYGDLEMGTVMAVETATGLLVPYIPDATSAADPGRVMLVTDNITATTFKIWKEDSGKIKAGDVIVLTDSDGAWEEATVLTVVIDADNRLATVTLTGATVTVGGFTVAKAASCWLKAGSANKRSTAKYILDQDSFTGDYDNPNGSLSSVFLSNGVLYKDSCTGLDATAVTALGAVIDGSFVIIK